MTAKIEIGNRALVDEAKSLIKKANLTLVFNKTTCSNIDNAMHYLTKALNELIEYGKWADRVEGQTESND